MRVQRLFHGHHHESIDYTDRVEEMGFKAWGVANAAIVDIDGVAVARGRP